MRFGSKILFEDVTTTFSPGCRYGLTGPNGSGKSTFMKLLAGDEPPQRGTVTRPEKVGVLRQDQFAFDRFTVADTVIMGNGRLWRALQEREALYEQIADLTDAQGMRLGELEGIVGHEDGYEAEANAAILLQGLDIPNHLHQRKMAELQGGQKVRVLLAQALFGQPAALLLDEPTNHLDLDSIHWLRDFMTRYEGTLIVVSHDRHFLNSVCTHIADIDYETIITYTGGYDDMVLAKTQARSRIEADNEQREKKIAQLQDFIARFSAGTRASQVMSRKKEVERLQTSDLARSNIRPPVHQVPDEPSVGQGGRRDRRRHEAPRRRVGGRWVQRDRETRRKSRAGGSQRRGQDHAAEGAALRRPGHAAIRRRHRHRHGRLGSRGVDRVLSPGFDGAHHERHDGRRLAPPVGPRRASPGRPWPARPDAVQR
jgi:ATPase subunit of ABC transporter with duplicated ATPase domains